MIIRTRSRFQSAKQWGDHKYYNECASKKQMDKKGQNEQSLVHIMG